nr:PREDICTED: uncharacterized protein LOC109457767 [Rhinolophus sinicus]
MSCRGEWMPPFPASEHFIFLAWTPRLPCLCVCLWQSDSLPLQPPEVLGPLLEGTKGPCPLYSPHHSLRTQSQIHEDPELAEPQRRRAPVLAPEPHRAALAGLSLQRSACTVTITGIPVSVPHSTASLSTRCSKILCGKSKGDCSTALLFWTFPRTFHSTGGHVVTGKFPQLCHDSMGTNPDQRRKRRSLSFWKIWGKTLEN